MPAKLHSCVKALMEKGHDEKAAYAICNASIDHMPLTLDCGGGQSRTYYSQAVAFDKMSKTAEGFLLFENAKLARVGIQDYLAVELNTPAGFQPFDTVKVYRPEEEVFHKESMDSFKLKPVTNNHPKEMVNQDNIKQYQVGTVGNDVRREGAHMVASLIITDKQAIKDIEAGKVELSNGYFSDYKFEKGVTSDTKEQYDAKQISIRGNHVALVQKGRCGSSCRVTDSKCPCGGESHNCKCGGKAMGDVQVTIDGLSVTMSDHTAQVVQKFMNKTADEKKALEEKLEKATTDHKAAIDKISADKDQAMKDLADAKAKIPTAQQLDAMVTTRQAFIKQVLSVDSKIKWEGKSEDELVREVVTTSFKDEDFKDQSPVYMKARFDALVKSQAKGGTTDATSTLDDAIKASLNGGNKEEVVDSKKAREKMMADSRAEYLSKSDTK